MKRTLTILLMLLVLLQPVAAAECGALSTLVSQDLSRPASDPNRIGDVSVWKDALTTLRNREAPGSENQKKYDNALANLEQGIGLPPSGLEAVPAPRVPGVSEPPVTKPATDTRTTRDQNNDLMDSVTTAEIARVLTAPDNGAARTLAKNLVQAYDDLSRAGPYAVDTQTQKIPFKAVYVQLARDVVDGHIVLLSDGSVVIKASYPDFALLPDARRAELAKNGEIRLSRDEAIRALRNDPLYARLDAAGVNDAILRVAGVGRQGYERVDLVDATGKPNPLRKGDVIVEYNNGLPVRYRTLTADEGAAMIIARSEGASAPTDRAGLAPDGPLMSEVWRPVTPKVAEPIHDIPELQQPVRVAETPPRDATTEPVNKDALFTEPAQTRPNKNPALQTREGGQLEADYVVSRAPEGPVRAIVKKVMDIWTKPITFDAFKEGLQEAVKASNDYIASKWAGKPFAEVVMGNSPAYIKSGVWVSDLVTDIAAKPKAKAYFAEPDLSSNGGEVQTMRTMIENGISRFVVYDDASYSGSQLGGFIQTRISGPLRQAYTEIFTERFQQTLKGKALADAVKAATDKAMSESEVVVVIPFTTQIARDAIKTLEPAPGSPDIGVKLVTSRNIKTLGDVVRESAEELGVKGIEDLVIIQAGRALGSTDASEKTSMAIQCFQHKIPDTVSTYGELIAAIDPRSVDVPYKNPANTQFAERVTQEMQDTSRAYASGELPSTAPRRTDVVPDALKGVKDGIDRLDYQADPTILLTPEGQARATDIIRQWNENGATLDRTRLTSEQRAAHDGLQQAVDYLRETLRVVRETGDPGKPMEGKPRTTEPVEPTSALGIPAAERTALRTGESPLLSGADNPQPVIFKDRTGTPRMQVDISPRARELLPSTDTNYILSLLPSGVRNNVGHAWISVRDGKVEVRYDVSTLPRESLPQFEARRQQVTSCS